MFSFFTIAPNGAVADDIEHVLDSVDLGKRRNIEHIHYVTGHVGVIVHYRTISLIGAQLVRDLQSENAVKLHVGDLDLDLHSHPIPRSKKTRK